MRRRLQEEMMENCKDQAVVALVLSDMISQIEQPSNKRNKNPHNNLTGAENEIAADIDDIMTLKELAVGMFILIKI